MSTHSNNTHSQPCKCTCVAGSLAEVRCEKVCNHEVLKEDLYCNRVPLAPVTDGLTLGDILKYSK